MGKAFMHTPDRQEHDLYESHGGLVDLLMQQGLFSPDDYIYEPCKGKNDAIINRLYDNGYKKVFGHDLYYGTEKKDFLESTEKVSNIITNPPYLFADEFVLKGKELYQNKMAMLLRTNYLSGQKRLGLGVYDELKYVMIFNRMPDLKAPIRYDGKFPTTGIVYAWYFFEKGYTGDPSIKFLDCSEYVVKNADRYDLDAYIDNVAGKSYINSLEMEKKKKEGIKKVSLNEGVQAIEGLV